MVRRLLRVRIGSLFNHDHVHQVAHSLPTALALADAYPSVEVILAVTTDALEQEVARLAGTVVDRGALTVRRLKIARPVRRLLVESFQAIAPAAKIAVYGEHLDFFGALDALVVSEKTSLVLKRKHRLQDLKLVHTRHGAGDRAIGFDRASARFDLVLAAGPKIARRLISDAKVAPERVRVVGYPKFDLDPAFGSPFPDPNDRRPIVLYNPHVAPSLSSWYRRGAAILDWFVDNPAYRLIFAPHVMLFRRRVAITVDPMAIACPGRIAARVRAAPNIRVDLGSAASTDASYVAAADIYLGDASSQVYEFLRQPRPCIFFDAHRSRWRGNPDFAHWTAGRVIERVDALPAALAHCHADHAARFRVQQERLFADTFDITAEPSAVRAARAIGAFLGLPPASTGTGATLATARRAHGGPVR